MPLNAWNMAMFKRIGQIWGQFIRVDDETLRDKSFAKRRILIASERTSKIEKWITVEVQGMKYEVLI